jgi:F-type H+-transporting ATPase subunit epsilon
VANAFEFKLLTPYKSLFEGQVESVGLPGAEGDFGVGHMHTKFASVLRPGSIEFVADGETHVYAVGGGYAEVTSEAVVVLADSAEAAADIDLDRAKESFERTKKELADADPADVDHRDRLVAIQARALIRNGISKSG